MNDGEKVDLGTFEDRDVASTTIAIRNTGHGLEQAMATDPQLMHHGDTIYVVLESEVEKVRFDVDDDTGNVIRVHMLKAGTATIVDASIVAEHIAAQHDRNLRAEEARKGQGRLGDDPNVDPVTGEVRNPETGEWEYPQRDGGGLDAGSAEDAL